MARQQREHRFAEFAVLTYRLFGALQDIRIVIDWPYYVGVDLQLPQYCQ